MQKDVKFYPDVTAEDPSVAMKEGLQPLTIEEYKRRQQRSTESPDTTILQKPNFKRRGGYLQRLKREKALLLREINSSPPPIWDKATYLWKRISEIESMQRNFLTTRQKQRETAPEE